MGLPQQSQRPAYEEEIELVGETKILIKVGFIKQSSMVVVFRMASFRLLEDNGCLGDFLLEAEIE